ncbi:MAG: D-2-hydroxyacid dehydrogenase [Thermomicrobiales bacterium]
MKLVLASFEGEAYFDMLNELPNLEIVRVNSEAEALPHMADCDVYYGRLSDALVAAAPRLKLVQSPGAGVDFLMNTPKLVESEIIVTNTRGAHGPSIAEHVFAFLLSFTRGIPQALAWQRDKHWGRHEGYRALHEIKDTTIGIVGYGQIGRAIAKRARAFETNAIAVDAHSGPGDASVEEVWPLSRLADLLRQADTVVISAPYTRESRHLIDAAALAAMKPSAYLIAISRGGIVDEDALAAALHAGQIAGAGVDVTEIEPLPADSPLWDAPNIIITPHLAGASGPKEQRCVQILHDNLVRLATGEPLINVVDKKAGY